MNLKNLTYGVALEAAKEGKLIAREGWNGKGMFVFMRPEDSIHYEQISKIKSLPESVKAWFEKKNSPDSNGQISVESVNIKFTAYLCMKAADGSIVNGWLASQTDMLCSDWTILEN